MSVGKRKVETVDYSVADAISSGVERLNELREELSDWYENMPESLQGGSKADELQEAMDALDGVDSFTPCKALDVDEEEKEALGAMRFQYTESRRRNQSRADRCSEACGLLRMAVDTVRAEVDGRDDVDDELAGNLDELEELIDNAEGVSWPGAR